MRTLALSISFIVGFLSLSQEILWVRLVSHGHGGRPFAFSWVLSAFLVGIALGALLGRVLSQRATDLPRVTGQVLMFAAMVDAFALLITPFVLYPAPIPLAIVFVLVMLCALGKAVVFPLVHHMGTVATKAGVGRSVSRVYFANVLGGTLGPVLTGFVLLDLMTATQAFLVIIVITMTLGIGVAYARTWRTSTARLAAACALAVLVTVVAAHRERDVISLVSTRFNGGEVERVLQGRHGVIHTVADTDGGGTVTLGGNVYDGRISTDMARNANELDRAYLMAVMHVAPRRVLVIGMSTGAWTAAVAGFPGVERVDVVEINPQYRDLIADSPDMAHILRDPKVRIHIDDGRRWLRAHPEQRFDLILQNTTFHWRANVSMLLSREYFQEVRAHLRPGGIMAVNTTHSLDVYATALSVFRDVVRYKHFAYMSDTAVGIRPDAAAVLRAAQIDGHPAFSESSFQNGVAAKLLAYVPQSARSLVDDPPPGVQPEIITDLNALTEYRHGLPSPLPFLRGLLPATAGHNG